MDQNTAPIENSFVDEILKTFVEIKLKNEGDFLRVKETLTRIGIPSFTRTPEDEKPKLYQSVHILHRKGRYYLVHFLQMFILDRREDHFKEEDRARLNTIAALLEKWGLVEIVNPEVIKVPRADRKTVKVIPYNDKKNWSLREKYAIGKIKKSPQANSVELAAS